MTYYAQRKSVKNGQPVAPNNRYGERAEMERQFHLYCASAATNADGNEVDAVEWGTIEQGALERKRWTNEAPEGEG
jgi:hypothetical protein